MEDTNGLRAKPPSPMPAPSNPNPELSSKPSKAREEGELSSSSSDELPAQPVGQLASTAAPVVESVPVAPVNKFTQGVKAGKSIPTSNSASSVGNQSRSALQLNYRKNFEKNRVPFKSGSSKWYAPSRTNNNLVISFSDGDSGSDSEENRQDKALESKGNTVGVDGNRRLLSSSLATSEILRRTIGNETKIMPKKASLSRTFISSRAKIDGPSSRGARTLLVEHGSRLKNSNAVNRNMANRDRGSSQGVVLDNSKLKDLREQIAIRETELKLKSAQQIKETVSASFRDYNAISLNNDAARKVRAASADIVQAEPKEPDKKRLKVSKTYSSHLNLDNQPKIPVVKSTLALKEPISESRGPHFENKVDFSHCDKEIPGGRVQSSIVTWQKQDGNLPSGSDGADINASCRQSDWSTRQEDPFVVVNQAVPIVNTTSNTFPKKLTTVQLNHPSKIHDHHPSSSFLSKTISEHNLTRSNEYREIHGDKLHKPVSDIICRSRSLKVPDSNLETSDTSPNNASPWNCLGKKVSGPSNMSLQSLLEIEDLQDKELEEAQEHRRRCEIEERNALKAYRKAQRALVEANARCNNLYRQREQYSARFQSLITEDSNLLWSSRQHEHGGIGLNPPYNISGGHVELMPTSSHQMQAECEVFNQPGFDSNIHFVNGAPLNRSYRHVDGQNLGSEPCSEPDGSTSELLPSKGNSAANGVCSPSNDPNISADEDDTISFDQESIQPSPECQRRGVSFEGREKDINDDSRRKFSSGSAQDSLLLEASLRSELFARLGMRTSVKDSASGDHSVEPAVERGAENDVRSETDQTRMGRLPLSEVDKSQHSDHRGIDRHENTITEVPVQNHHQCASHAATDPEENRDGWKSTKSITFSTPSILRSAFGHMKVTFSISFIGLQSRDQHKQTYDIYEEESTGVSSDEIQPSSLIANSVQETVTDIFAREFGSYTCDLAIDPFWPLCMYELRGKCNDEECSWQHVKDYSSRIMNQHHDSDRTDCLVGPSSHRAKFNAQRIEQCWQKSFSSSLAVSRFLRRDLPADEPFLHGIDGRIGIRGNWNWQSLYFQSGNGTVNQPKHDLADNVQSIEMALLILNQEVNKSEGMKKALSVLSRALEADPTAVVLWIVYLLIYYSTKKSIEKDDMFLDAVKRNEGSYELWLLYINSRMQLNDRLVAYDTALTALCHQVSDSDRDAMLASSCILDLFLQMVDCLCMSGDVGKAIQRIYGLFPTATDSNGPHSLVLSDILTCLTISDKCIFWVCCVYVVIYRKLPDAIVQRFECEKEISVIEWPSVELRVDEKQQAVKLMEMAVDSVESCINRESFESEATRRSVHLFALSHISCLMALEGFECSWNLLDKYIELYPSCLELVLISSRVQKPDFEDLSFVGFEEALSKWPNEVPGIQCIWNQYAEYALQNGRFDFAKELMLRWRHSSWEAQYPQNGILDAIDGDNPCSVESASASNWGASISYSKRSDVMFGLLNLSLHRLLQNDDVEARLAIDRALKAAAPENYKHCVREHAMFLFSGCSQLKDDASISELLNILKSYLVDAQVFPVTEPLSRKFIQGISKPRIRQLISNILNPISSDFSLVNLVLEVWYGPSLVPRKFNKPKDLVDFVEAIMEIVPSNYELAFSVCKLLSRDLNSADVTSAGVLFWASSLLVNTIFQAVPVAPEHVWVEASDVLGNFTDIQEISETFHKRAVLVYPFSIKLWKSYLNLSKTTGNMSDVVEAAREKGMKLD
ncbi:hypothetical protein L1049_011808 [Liquidambar formosana]|uniref:Putative zinc-finger domain-containing protein n=1 Tax=Liquidambar formosana TaxID=63359 RepID=A0AAP0RS49_LIQFO